VTNFGEVKIDWR